MKKILVVAVCAIFTFGASLGQADDYSQTLKKMLEVAGSEASYKAAINQMFDMFKKQNSSVPENIWTELRAEFLKTSLDDLVRMLSPVYQKHLAKADLQKIIDFYQTPTGKKFAEKTPLIMQESMQVGQEWGMKIGEAFQKKLKEKGY